MCKHRPRWDSEKMEKTCKNGLSPENLGDLEKVLFKAVRVAGQILVENYEKLSEKDVIVKKRNDYVTWVDKEVEKAIIGEITNFFPSHRVVAEESPTAGPNRFAGVTWVVDPLDGTTNYIHGVPYFTTSIAVEKDGKPFLAAVYDPMRDELFHAKLGRGAYLNGKKIKVSQVSKLSETLFATGFPCRNHAILDKHLKLFKDFFLSTSGARRLGAASLDLAYVAAGRYDVFWEFGLARWDIAAGCLIVAEAGGVVTDFEGGETHLDTGNVVASNGKLHSDVLKLLNPCSTSSTGKEHS